MTILESAKAMAVRKGLQLKKNQFRAGWSITLPNGGTHNLETDLKMIRYVQGY